MSTWADAVRSAVMRQGSISANGIFTRADLLEQELDRIVAETGSIGMTPHQTLSRELQELRKAGFIEFVDNAGTYRLVG